MKLKILLTAMIFFMSFLASVCRSWPGSPIFLSHFYPLQKAKQISLLRALGLHTSPFRVRAFLLLAYPNQPPEAHELAHLIGETAYMRYGPSGFRFCDSVFTYACFHGVILAALKAHGYDEHILADLTTGCTQAGKNDTAKVSCAHGIGHGIMWVKNYDLVPSFQLCDRIFADKNLRFFCWDGVSMENVVRRSDTALKLPAVPWHDDDIYFPCDSIPQIYEAACTREHLFLLRINIFARDTQKSIDYCMHFPAAGTREQCLGALGGALEQDDPTNTDYVIGECLKVPMPYSIHCLGRAATQYAFAGQKNTGMKLCDAMASVAPMRACVDSVNAADSSRYIIQE